MTPAKSQKLLYTRRLLITDFVAVVLSIVLSGILNFQDLVNTFSSTETTGILRIQLNPASLAWAMGITWLLALKLNGSREDRIIGGGSDEYKRIFGSSITVISLLALAALFLKLDVSRLFVGFSVVIGTIALVLGRWIWRQWLRTKRANNQFKERVAIAGPAALIQELAEKLLKDKQGAYTPALLIPLTGTLTTKIKQETNFDDPAETLRKHKLDALIVVGTENMSSKHLKQISWNMEKSNATLIVAPGLLEVAGPRVHTRPISGMPLLELETPRFEGSQYLVKSLFDFVFASLVLVLLTPIFLIVALAIFTEDRGPVFFQQMRIGKDQKPFKILKFRSMYVGADKDFHDLKNRTGHQINSVQFKLKDDTRITQVGKFIRKYSIDELPQFLNVLKGEMSVVGPRPHMKTEVEMYDQDVFRRLYVKPGITGIWQISGRNSLSWEDTVRMDLFYVENWSPISDALIVLKTLKAVFRGTGY
jgi:exopolysaccharide biosynthesis polyprenyl glycosylphosphotransferase